MTSLSTRSQGAGEAGVTLLLSILILSTVLAIAFSIATVLFIEVRNSGDLLRTEPAIYAATGVTEESLFLTKRRAAGTYTSQIGAVRLESATTTLTEPIFLDKVLSISTDLQNTRSRYPLYDPAQPFGGLDPVTGLPVGASNYGRIQVTHVDTGTGGTVYVYLCQFDPRASQVDCANAASPDMLYRNISLLEGQSTPQLDLDPSKQQELILFGSGPSDKYVQITAFGPSPYLPKGIPYFGQTAVEVTASSTNLTRKLRVRVPNNTNP